MSAAGRAAEILIVGQGLAETMLAWECERAGIPFAFVDAGHEGAATRVAAGIINPITGRRLVKSWRIEAWRPVAQAAYRDFGAALGVTLWRELRVRRSFADERERRVLTEKRASGELGGYAGADTAEGDGFWIEGAARVDLPLLLRAARARRVKQGRLRGGAIGVPGELAGSYELVIDCTGRAGARSGAFGFVPWEFSKGEVLALAMEGLDPDVILSDGRWLLPVTPGVAWVGATHEQGSRRRGRRRRRGIRWKRERGGSGAGGRLQ